jgi:hypothetical protein
MLKAKGHRIPEFFGLTEAEFKELALLALNCEKHLGLSVSDLSTLGPNGRKGVRLSLSGNYAYAIILSPSAMYLESGPIGSQPRLVFRNQAFNHLVAGQLFRTIEAQEKSPCLA